LNTPALTGNGTIISGTSGGSVTFVVQHRVRNDAFARYEEWLKRIVAVCSTYPGYQGVDIIRPVAGDNEYSTIVRFATFADAERWCKSKDRPRLIAEITDILERDDRARIQTGIDFWFTPTSVQQPQPLRWKQWFITTTVIWPLMLLIPPLFQPLFAALPWLGMYGIRQAVIASTIVALVVFLIMPRYVRAIAGWLYSRPKGEA
jgi:antibiotic biosynthesis monooxygenase (ABM) superfamily enzyme